LGRCPGQIINFMEKFVTRINVDGKLILCDPELPKDRLIELITESQFSTLSLERPSDDAAMEIVRKGCDFTITGGEDSTDRGGFCFSFLNGSVNNEYTDDVLWTRKYSTLSDLNSIVQIAALYYEVGDLHPDYSWHVSRAGNGQDYCKIPSFEKFGKGFATGDFRHFLASLPKSNGL
jgi:hypothetical protein